MNKIRIGVICPSEIAFRRFMPAVKQLEDFEYAGVAIASPEEWGGTYTEQIRQSELSRAQNFVDNYGGKIFEGYHALIESDEVDAVYLPLPPALHFQWGKKVLEASKHLFLEKPSTTSAADTKVLVEMAEARNLALHENYMFAFHSQLDVIDEMVKKGEIGDVRLYRISFGFPRRAANDFRYNKALGGGALLDCGGYTLKLAGKLLGESAELVCSKLNYLDDFEVDMYGSATMMNASGQTAQISFGMDNSYKCDLEVWGSTGCISTGRIFTAPVGFKPQLELKKGNETTVIEMEADDTFVKSICRFKECVVDSEVRKNNYNELISQAELVDKVKER